MYNHLNNQISEVSEEIYKIPFNIGHKTILVDRKLKQDSSSIINNFEIRLSIFIIIKFLIVFF